MSGFSRAMYFCRSYDELLRKRDLIYESILVSTLDYTFDNLNTTYKIMLSKDAMLIVNLFFIFIIFIQN